jgi:two-component system sensor histidine kinase KdpD
VPRTAVRFGFGAARRATTLARRRRVAGWALAVGGVPLLTVALVPIRHSFTLPGDLMAYLLVVLVAATVGGLGPAVVAAVGSSLASNWFFTPPFRTFAVADAANVVALVVFVAVGCVVAALVSLAARHRSEAALARREAEVLARAAADLLLDDDPLPGMLQHICTAFGLEGAAVLVRPEGSTGWVTEASVEDGRSTRPALSASVELGEGAKLLLHGRSLSEDDLRVLRAFSYQLADARERARLRTEAARMEAVAAADALRTALLRAVSHDLRTPLASIKVSVTSLLQRDVRWTTADSEAFLTTIDEATDRLDALVGNLLDMSRLQAGAVHPRRDEVDVADVVAAALASLGDTAPDVTVDLPKELPSVLADAALAERSLANVVSNAARHATGSGPVALSARLDAGTVHLEVADHGPGVPAAQRDRLFEPFQRLGDHPGGVGLGLAVARGFLTAMGGDLVLGDTPGGGLTADLCLPAATTPARSPASLAAL